MERLNKDINVIIATHKKFELANTIDERIYVPIQVGIGESIGYLRENQLDNIADKNKNFCEITLLYFIWKNVKSDYIGMVHYRRYLGEIEPLNKPEIEAIFAKNPNTIILPHPLRTDITMEDQYKKGHFAKDWEHIKCVIQEKYPLYLDSFFKFGESKEGVFCNMFIAPKSFIDAYCEWLFDILFELERRIDISEYDDYQGRLFGFLAERLFNVYLLKHKRQITWHHTNMLRIE